MKIVLFFFIFTSYKAIGQSSDFILLKKNGHTLKAFYAGQVISFGTASGNFTGLISSINRDSIFFTQYNVRQMPTNLGVYVLDTVSVYKLRFNYRDIAYVGRKQSGFDWAATGGSLFGGGILLTTVGLGTWLFTKPGTQYYASPALVIGSAVLGGIGYLLLKSRHSYILGNKYQLEYVSTGKPRKN